MSTKQVLPPGRNALMQFKAMILTNAIYSPSQREAAAKLLESIDQDLEISGPYEPSDVTLELIEDFDKALCEIDDSNDDSPIEVDDEDDAGIRKPQLLEGFDDSGTSGTK